MNIFAVDSCPVRAAQALCDRHVVKMALESAQTLCSSLHGYCANNLPYRPTHLHHPCVRWAAQSVERWLWLYQHTWALCAEYEARYDRRHACEAVLLQVWPHQELLPVGGAFRFVQCFPVDYRLADAVLGYRRFYRARSTEMKMIWTRTTPPSWLGDHDG